MLKEVFSYSIVSSVKKFRLRRVLYIAIFWTTIDLIATILNFNIIIPEHTSFGIIP